MMLSVVIPAYNEERRLGNTLRGVRDFLEKRGHLYEIIVVDDGSTDQTVQVAQQNIRPGADKVLRNEENCGKGFSVKRGMLEARGDFVLFTDADLSTPIEEVTKFLNVLTDGYEVAFGSRGFPESRVEIRQNLLRETMGQLFNRVARLFTFKGIRDSQCGFKCFTKRAARDLFSLSKINGFGFDAEILFLGQKLKYRMKEVPVAWANSLPSRVPLFRGGISMLWDLICILYFHHFRSGARRGNENPV